METIRILNQALFTENTIIGVVIICAILFSGLYAYFLGYSPNVSRYKSETSSVNKINGEIEKWKAGKIQWEDEYENLDTKEKEEFKARYNELPIRSFYDMAPKSLIGKRLDIMILLKEKKAKLSLESLQNLTFTIENEQTSMKVPGLVSTLSMMFGMLGTCVGLILLFHSLSDNNGGGDIEYKNLISGVRTAFSTTIVGLACSIWATWLNYRLENTQIAYFAKLESITINNLIPHAFPDFEDQSTLKQIAVDLKTSFSDTKKIIGENHAIIRSLTPVQESFRVIIEDIRRITQRESSANLGEIIIKLTQMHNMFNEVQETQNGKFQLLEKMENINDRQLGDYNRIMDNLGQLPNLIKGIAIILGLILVGFIFVIFKS